MKYLAIPFLLFAASCVPLQDTSRELIDYVGGDDATLIYCLGEATAVCNSGYGLGFDPAESIAYKVIVDVLGENLGSSDTRCQPLGSGLSCELGDVNEPTLISLYGSDVTATATYRRSEESLRVYQILVE